MGFLPTTKYKNNERIVSGSVNVENSDMLLNVDTSSVACTINLQSIPSDNWNTLYKLYVKDISGNAGTNNITIVAPNGYKINNTQTLILNTNGESALIRIGGNLDYVSFPNKAGHIIQDEGVNLPQQPILDFVGSGVTVTNGVNKTIVTIPSGGITQAYTTVQNEGSSLPQRNIIDFVGTGVNATDNGTKTIVTINDCCDFVELTNTEMIELISNGTVDAGTYYKITNPINADEGVIIQGIVTNANPSLQGSGIFLNADYQGIGDYSGVSGFVGNLNVYGDIPRPVVIGNVVIWNNLHYKNLTGNWGINPDLDPTNWELLPKNVTNGYIREVDFIKYNVYTNRVIYRADRRLNEVDYASYGSSNNILEFQWGKNRVTGNKLKGVGRMICTNSYATFTNNLIEGTLTDATQVNELIGSYVSNIISNDSYITCSSYNYGFVKNNILTGASYILFDNIQNSAQIIDNNLSTSSYIDINLSTGYIAFINNILQNESHFTCPNLQASISNNSISNRSWIEIDNCYGTLIENRLNCGSQLIIGYVQTLIQYNQLDNNSVITINDCQSSWLKNTLDKSVITINIICNYMVQRNYLCNSVIIVPTFNATFEENNLQKSSIIGSEFNFSNYITNCIISIYDIDLSVITNGQQYKTLNQGYSNFDKTLDLDNPAIYDLPTQTLNIQDFGIIGIYRLTNTTSKIISKITINYGGNRVMRFYTDTSLTFQHTVISSATNGDLVCDAPASANTIIGRTIGSDFIEYQQSIDGGQCLNLRTNLVKLA